MTLLFAATMTFGTRGFAYPVPVDFDGKLLHWNVATTDDPVVFDVINESGMDDATAATIVSAAAELWSNIPGSKLRLVESSDRPGIQPMVTLYFKANFDGGNFSAAYAVFDEYNDDDSPAHCLVKIAVRGGESMIDLKKTVLHELGHCLGLGHSLFPKAIMSYRLEENSFALDTDDKAAMVRLYPEDNSISQLPAGCTMRRTQRNTPDNSDFPDDFGMFLLPLAAALWRLTRIRQG